MNSCWVKGCGDCVVRTLSRDMLLARLFFLFNGVAHYIKRVVLIDFVVLLRDTESDPMSKSNQVVLNLLPRRKIEPHRFPVWMQAKNAVSYFQTTWKELPESAEEQALLPGPGGQVTCPLLAHVGSFSPFWLFLFHISRQVVPTFRHSPRAGQHPQTQLAVPSFAHFWTTKLDISFHRLVAFLRLPVFEGAIMAYMRATRLALSFGCGPAQNLLLRHHGRGAM